MFILGAEEGCRPTIPAAMALGRTLARTTEPTQGRDGARTGTDEAPPAGPRGGQHEQKRRDRADEFPAVVHGEHAVGDVHEHRGPDHDNQVEGRDHWDQGSGDHQDAADQLDDGHIGRRHGNDRVRQIHEAAHGPILPVQLQWWRSSPHQQPGPVSASTSVLELGPRHVDRSYAPRVRARFARPDLGSRRDLTHLATIGHEGLILPRARRSPRGYGG